MGHSVELGHRKWMVGRQRGHGQNREEKEVSKKYAGSNLQSKQGCFPAEGACQPGGQSGNRRLVHGREAEKSDERTKMKGNRMKAEVESNDWKSAISKIVSPVRR